jgi:hypothetical protein
VKGSRFEGDRVLQSLHQCGVFGDIIVLMADPFGNADRALVAAADYDSNARRTRISQATTVHIGHKFAHGCEIRCLLQCAPIPFVRQDDYLILFHHFAVDCRAVQFYVQKASEFPVDAIKFFS